MIYAVWYRKEPTFQFDENLTVADVENTHTYVRSVDTETMDGAFREMQAEIWSPNGEYRGRIKRLGLRHTSMSIGDVLERKGIFHQCDMCGWAPVPDKTI